MNTKRFQQTKTMWVVYFRPDLETDDPDEEYRDIACGYYETLEEAQWGVEASLNLDINWIETQGDYLCDVGIPGFQMCYITEEIFGELDTTAIYTHISHAIKLYNMRQRDPSGIYEAMIDRAEAAILRGVGIDTILLKDDSNDHSADAIQYCCKNHISLTQDTSSAEQTQQAFEAWLEDYLEQEA